jgi:predicted metalloendopeptidase
MDMPTHSFRTAFVVLTGLALLAASPADLRSGVDLQYIDSGVRPQDDFFRNTQGKWLKDVQIPYDRSSWGAFNVAQDKVEGQIQALVEQAEKDTARTKGSENQKIGDFYASYTDEARRNTLGIQPLKAELARIDGLKDKRDMGAVIARLLSIGVGTPVSADIHQDNKDSTRYLLDLSQSGLGMPNRDYYLSSGDARLMDTKAKYQGHVEKMLALAGVTGARDEAAAIVALETAIATAHWTAVQNRDPVKSYNKTTLTELKALTPSLDWDSFLQGLGAAPRIDSVNVSQPSYLKDLSKLIDDTPLATWQAYLRFRLLSTYAAYLSQAFVDESFAFRGAVLSGAQQNRPLAKRAIAEVNRSLGMVVGKAYVKAYFPPERKAQVEAMARNFLAAFKDGIGSLDWMSADTKVQARAKLAKVTVKIGYPDVWPDFSGLTVERGDLTGNIMRAREFDRRHEIDKLGKPVDRAEWGMTPQTVNAYYNPDAEPAINYGAVGISIGHELSHAFDDQGSQFDGDGNLRNWWTKEDAEKFAARGKMLVAQYAGYSPLPGYNVNGELTLGENIADNAGAIMATRAYRISLNGKEAPVIDGYTADQRIFIGIAQARRGKARDAALIAQVKSDPHSPSEFRVNGSLRNHPGFYEAFGVKPGDKMYLAPAERVTFW